MIIVDPVTLGDVACTRASPKWVFDRSGTLVQVPADTLAVTYDPSDLSKAPYALVEAAATNVLLYSSDFTNAVWTKANLGAGSQPVVTPNFSTAPDGSNTAQRVAMSRPAGGSSNDYSLVYQVANAGTESKTGSLFLKSNTGQPQNVLIYGDTFVGRVVTVTGVWQRFELPGIGTTLLFGTRGGSGFYYTGGDASLDILAWNGQLEVGNKSTSPIPTGGAPVARAADVIAPGAGLVYSNVPITEAPYNAATTYAKDALAYDPVTHNVFQSLAAGNVGKALTDTTAWTPRGATNRWAMLDQYNNTQTTNPSEILMVVSPQAISQGLYLGNLYVDEVRISVVDKVEGLVYSETKSLVESNSASSFFNWAFKRIRRKDYFLTLELPAYANALVTISLRKIGGVAKCGMCAIGPTDEFGPTLMGLSTEGKDYSTTTFNFDGTSSTIIRPYAKRMTCDVMVDNGQIDYLQARLFEIRQKPIVWVGGPYGSTAVYGRYESFKNVIQYATRSLMNLTIGGAV